MKMFFLTVQLKIFCVGNSVRCVMHVNDNTCPRIKLNKNIFTVFTSLNLMENLINKIKQNFSHHINGKWVLWKLM